MQCGYQETLVPTRGLATIARPGEYFIPRSAHRHRQSMTSARVTLTTFESAVFDRGAQNSLTDELVLTVCLIPRCVRDWQCTMTSFPPPCMRNEKTVVTNFAKCVIVAFWRHNVDPYAHFAVYESLNRCTRARFCCRLEVGSPISAFRFPLFVSIVNLKNTTPSDSGDIPREHYRHCQYRLRGLRYNARGLASIIIKGNVRRHLVITHASIINIVNTGYGA